ncbi:COG4223 family protein [Oharaeibacter diazotrophicus]|uniref:Inner membrane protein n=1 Tax=Oharaeibacter diazotrophicus TaxID=1920512 RepID=A0A4R6R783_9HYPH|nr:hypothetical protein [Oharaeibacter diazotrophicus]TDP81833.1 hypothetical protein EDD54_4093 [Oharaeibacter diazotrophicus]BBE73465.1 hypothetical protein OHA_1_03078 [Pleomorphomonas sp. SM30]GLS75255.1 hypothetical protein GCM10007904_05900 [Oharaeibacter diazotrophicus]
MTSDSDPTGRGPDHRRRKGRPTTIDLTATPVRVPPAVEPSSEPAPDPAPSVPPDQPLATAETAAPVGEDIFVADPPAPAAEAATEAAAPAAVEGAPVDGEAAASAGEASATESPAVETAATEPVVTETAAAEPTAAEAAPAEPIAADVGSNGPDTAEPSEAAGAASAESEPSPAAATAVPTPPAAEPTARTGTAGLIAAALIGGLVALGGGAALIAGGVFRPPLPEGVATTTVVADIDRRLAEVGDRLGRIEQAPPATAAPDTALAGRVDALERSVAAVQPADPALAQRLADVEATVKTLPSGGGTGTADPALAPRVDDLGKRLEDVAPRLDTLAADVAALREAGAADRAALEKLAAAPAPVDPARIDALEKGASDLGARLDAVDAALADIRRSLDDRIGGLDRTLADGLAGVKQSVGSDMAALTARVDDGAAALTAATGRLDDVEKRLDAGPKGGEIAALSLAVTTLSSRIAEGAPFAADLGVVAAVAPDLPELAALQPLAEHGVDTIDALAAGLPYGAVAAARPVTDGAGAVDRLLAGAKSLVNYRETGADAADPASRALEGIRAGLASGDAAAARAAADGLPDWAKAATADWLARLDRRVAADAAVKALTAKVLARLEAPAEGR